MAASTSRAAPLISRLRSNCSVMDVELSELEEVISLTPAMCPNWRSRGVATDDAIIWALAPGRLACTEMVGKSTWGSGETGNTLNPTAPAMATAIVSRIVATGRRMNGAEIFMIRSLRDRSRDSSRLHSSCAYLKDVAPDGRRRYR